MKKTYFLIIIIIFSLLNAVLVGYSTFYFNTEVSNSPNVDVAVNNIAQNYGRNTNSADYFDVYFFPQPRFASKNNPLNYQPQLTDMNYDFKFHYEMGRKTSGDGGLIDGYWSSSKLNLEKEYDLNANGDADSQIIYSNTIDRYMDNLFPNGLTLEEINEAMNYRKITNVYKRLTIQQIEEIGNPKTAMLDRSNWTYQFTGWTANQSSAINNGYGGMKDFALIDSLVPLSIIDSTTSTGEVLSGDALNTAINNGEKGIDGSLIGDRKVYIYPIFAIGKDYSVGDIPSVQPSSFDLSKDKGYNQVHKFLSYKQENLNHQVKGYYETKNIYYSEQDSSPYKFKADMVMNSGWGGVDNKVSDLPVFTSSGSTNLTFGNYPVIDEAGYYNVYCVILTNVNSSFIDYGTVNDKDVNFLYDVFKSRTSNIHHYFLAKGYVNGYEVGIWTWVERVYEYKIIGGPADTFNYYSLSAPLIYNISKNGTGVNYSEEYIVDNVLFNSEDSTFKYKHTYVNDEGLEQTVVNEYKETIFTLAADNSGVNYTVNINNSPSINNTFEDPKQHYNGNYLRSAIGGKQISDTVDYTYTFADTLQNKLLKVTEPGYYDFYFKVNYINEEINNIEVSARKVSDVISFIKFVDYIPSDNFNRIQPFLGQSFINIDDVEQGRNNLFDLSVKNYYFASNKSSYYSTKAISVNTRYDQLLDLQIDEIDCNTNKIISTITLRQMLENKKLVNNKEYILIDHTTGLPIDLNSTSVIRLSHIFYIREKTLS